MGDGKEKHTRSACLFVPAGGFVQQFACANAAALRGGGPCGRLAKVRVPAAVATLAAHCEQLANYFLRNTIKQDEPAQWTIQSSVSIIQTDGSFLRPPNYLVASSAATSASSRACNSAFLQQQEFLSQLSPSGTRQRLEFQLLALVHAALLEKPKSSLYRVILPS